jgi:hypothetical protein
MPMAIALVFAAPQLSPPKAEPAPRVAAFPAAVPPPLRLRLEAPHCVRAGQPVPLRLVLENQGNRPVEVGLGGRPIAFDFVITAPDGSELWRRTEDVAASLLLQLRTLAHREAIALSDSWNQQDHRCRRVEPGCYRVRGILPVEGAPGGWATDTHLITILS